MAELLEGVAENWMGLEDLAYVANEEYFAVAPHMNVAEFEEIAAAEELLGHKQVVVAEVLVAAVLEQFQVVVK